MKRGWIAAAVVLLGVATLVTTLGLSWCAHLRSTRLTSSEGGTGRTVDEAAVARIRGIPLYRTLLRTKALRSGTVDRDGTLRLEVDLRAVVEPRLAALGLAEAPDLFPRLARGTIGIDHAKGAASTADLRESWTFDGRATVFDLLDRNPPGKMATPALDAIPGAPSAMAYSRLVPSRLADPSFGGAALASWRDRVGFAEKLLGRPLRAEIAEDLAGPVVFALYETSDETEADAVLAVELRRSDRLAGLLDMLFSLGALTERATVRRYRGVPTGSFLSDSGGPGLALAVDGSVLLVATSRAQLESAIDTRRAGSPPAANSLKRGDFAASWSAVSASAFVRNGWAHLTRTADDRELPSATTTAALWPDGTSGWRLEGHGPSPAITADPILPFLRSVFARRQREGD